ncbi:class I SAM-dependent methyltransferase [Breoghania sp. L-A4]|uniref:class I SAM-dependent methyltransferase n=1 Tax=Breoghania sp. L-A4 TaxID=2304600 RepID=UPI000E358B6F|nr:class I SAM-dependent methyltransferase [Breoghania sp. L-A4]AXS41944.1 class I SAM-dependent methyltransferase [Breoghania sp. L-A4]
MTNTTPAAPDAPSAPAAVDFTAHFSDPEAVARYSEGPPRFVPGFDALHRMTGLLLAEKAPRDARVLILGAGGGLELKALAAMYPCWRFVGVDPAAAMLGLARRTLGAQAQRAMLVEGYIDDAPEGPFDAAVCLLTLHFLDRDERRRTLREIHRRLAPGAPFVAAHSSFPQDEAARERWLSRYMAFAVASGADPVKVASAKEAVAASLCLYEPEEDAEFMREAGFSGVELFYAAFTWRGWVATA